VLPGRLVPGKISTRNGGVPPLRSPRADDCPGGVAGDSLRYLDIEILVRYLDIEIL
jgi:hypothetical protein